MYPRATIEVKDDMATPTLRHFELIGADGRPLRGDIRTVGTGADRPAVVICHGFKGFKDWGFFPHVAERLARGGITAVSFNFSGSGVGIARDRFDEPDRFARWTYSNDIQDTETVIGALRGGTLADALAVPAKVGLLGHSRGGGVGVLYAARHPEALGALVTWSAIGSTRRWGPETIRRWRAAGHLDVTNSRTGEVLPLGLDILDDLERAGTALDIGAAAEQLAVPWLIVHGESDETVPVRDGLALAERSGGRAELLTIPHGTHTFGVRHPWAGTTPAFVRALDATADWFARYLF
jgi:pimeloyl-ACP methyl ester carboxylesterase